MSDGAPNRIKPGPLRGQISARAWNRAQDAADIVLGDRYSQAGEPQADGPKPYTPILARNSTTGTVNRWGVLSVAGVVFTPSGATGNATQQFQDQPVLSGGLPTGGSSFVVAVEPIAAGKIGRVAVAGVVQAKINVVSESDTFATAKDGDLTQLSSASSGEVTILWKESGTGAGKWALVRFGAGGGSLKLSRTTSVWEKGTTASLVVYGGTPGSEAATGETFNAFNNFGKVLSGKWVMIGETADGQNYLIAPEADQVELVYTAEIVSTTASGVTTSKLVFRRKKVWVHSIEEGTPVEIGMTECVTPYSNNQGGY